VPRTLLQAVPGTLRVLVCGSRTYRDGDKIERALARLVRGRGVFRIVVCEGGARGADTLAKKAAHELGIHVFECDAVWARYGHSAGPIRNRVMLRLFEPHVVLAFKDTKDTTNYNSGTDDMVARARKDKNVLKVVVFE
jgi:YspA, cpYpsA-related SLOG family